MQRVPLDGARLVDVGAGTGRIARLVGSRVRHVHLVDRAAPMLEVAARRLAALGGVAWTITEGDARALPLGAGVADIAVAGWVFGHFRHWMPDGWQDEVDAAVGEMRRVIRPGGRLVIIETLGTGHETPQPGPLDVYFERLERAHGFQRSSIRTDYAFPDPETAADVCGRFFGEAFADRVRERRWARVPECTAIFVADRP